MKLSKREKTLLAILLIIGLSFLYYNYMLTPQLSRISELRLKLEEQQNNVNVANMQMSKDNQVYKDYKILNAKVEQMTSRFFHMIVPESYVLFMDDMIKSSGIEASSISFSEITLGIPSEKKEEEEDKKVDPDIQRMLNEIMGKSTGETDNSSANTDGTDSKGAEAANKENAYGLEHISATLNIEGTYFEIVDFMKKIEIFDKKILINSLNLTSNETGSITGSIVLDFYAMPKLNIVDEDYANWTFENDFGKDNPFSSYSGYVSPSGGAGRTAGQGQAGSQKGAAQAADYYDFIFAASPMSADIPTFIIGYAKDKSGVSYVYDDSDKIESAVFEIIEEDGKYYYRYKIGNSSYPKDYTSMVEFMPIGKNIVLKLSSSPRLNEKDNNGINLTIVNSTNKKLEISFFNEDGTRPRFNIVKQTGDVTIVK
ncbi:MAG: hypothetical protein ACOZCL_12765 [Bacillota bacterium]